MLRSVNYDLNDGLSALNKMFYIDNQEHDLPVAFATNAMYVLAKNKVGDQATIT